MPTLKISVKKLRYLLKYNKYFSLDFLIKYGYFDFKYNRKKVDEEYILSNIVFKKVFNTNDLYNNFKEIKNKVNFKSIDTAPIELSIYKNENERRRFKLPNIYSYICLCIHLNDNRDTYMDILDSSKKSLSNEFYNTTFLKGKIRREENRIGKRYIFKTDIQNFYPSIYTHSISWILVGKDNAKKNKNDKTKYYNQLDTLIQRCQRGETQGIPIGTFASRLIAEIFMCRLDNKLDRFPYVRYVDDFELPYNDESEKNEFYKELNIEINNLNLNVKVEKNQVDSFPFQSDNNSAFFFDYFSTSEKDVGKQIKRIYHFIDSSIFKEREGYKGSLKLMFKALGTAINEDNILQESINKSILKKLFNLVLMTPHLSVLYLEFLDVLDKDIIENELKKSFKDIIPQININLERYIELNYSQELYSLLTIFFYLDIRNMCDKEMLYRIIEKMDDLSSILSFELLLLDEKNITESLIEAVERKLENSNSWEEDFWLFKYHFFLRLNESKKAMLYKKYKKYLYNKFGEGIEKTTFFNKKSFSKLKSPINLEWQQKNTNQDIANFFKYLLDKKVRFFTNY